MSTEAAQPLSWLRELCRNPEAIGNRLAVLACLASHVSGTTGQGYASVDQLQREAGVKRSTVQRTLRWARNAGWLMQVSRGYQNRRTGKPVASVWALRQPDAGVTTDTSTAAETPEMQVSPAEPSPDLTPNPADACVTTADACVTGDPLREVLQGVDQNPRSATPPVSDLPQGWVPSQTHARSMSKSGLDEEQTVAAFVRWARNGEQNERRADWDRTFGRFINAEVEGRLSEEFGGAQLDPAGSEWVEPWRSDHQLTGAGA